MPKQPSKTTNLDSSPAVQLARVKSSNSTIPPISNTSIIQSRIRHTDSDVDNNEQAQKRQRTYFIYRPFDSNLAGKNVFNPNFRFSPISLTKLENIEVQESSVNLNLNMTFLDIQIMRVITANNDPANVYSRRGRVQNPTRTFKRLILARCSCYKHEEEQNRLVYLWKQGIKTPSFGQIISSTVIMELSQLDLISGFLAHILLILT